MWERKEVKAIGKLAFKANYWRSVLSALILMILLGGSAVSSYSNSGAGNNPELEQSVDELGNAYNSLSNDQQSMLVAGLIGAGLLIFVIGFVLKAFIFNPLEVGCYGFFKDNIASQGNVDLGVLKTGFGNYGHTFITLLLRDIFLILWCCLCIVPGIVKSYSYRMVPFILRDHPELSPQEVITRSRQMMNGHKWNVFVFDLSYIGWHLLGAITLGLVDVFWTEPYRQNANALIYLRLSQGQQPQQPFQQQPQQPPVF